MKERAPEMFPFGIAIALPPAGFLLGLFAISQGDREQGVRVAVVAVLAAAVWALLLFG